MVRSGNHDAWFTFFATSRKPLKGLGSFGQVLG